MTGKHLAGAAQHGAGRVRVHAELLGVLLDGDAVSHREQESSVAGF
jgi:hypothetical protein